MNRLAGYRLVPIDLARHLETCREFHRDMLVASFGSAVGFEEDLGPAYEALLRERCARLPEGNAHLWHGEAIVGQTEMRIIDAEPGLGYVNLFYLVPQARGLGLGRILHQHAAAVFTARGMRAMRLSVSVRNEPAIAFYRRLGWRSVGMRPNREPMHVMEYRL